MAHDGRVHERAGPEPLEAPQRLTRFRTATPPAPPLWRGAGTVSARRLDSTKNTSRRFCSLACQNRAKSAAYRQKQCSRPG
ncbi:CGNR zinc finger domain-containing protein [Dactylosporangium sp. NPDC048998]|uniref:CGNR zinc finger domain-containing protein n=1 Tax=Dactylosporangium sp. NPDC048998 TaxID=3363976 RepID=UPI00371EE617